MFKMPIGLYEKAPPDELSREERLTAAGQIGYDYVKTSIDESVEMRGSCIPTKILLIPLLLPTNLLKV
jgi:L-ribulose-5-phosphate 3-epimerase UlaE